VAAQQAQPRTVIHFYSTAGEYGCFSNFSRHPIRLKGKTWPTSEHYFQAQKFAGEPDEEEVRQAKTPMIAARMGRDRKRPLRRDWEAVEEQVMLDALRAKFTQDEELAAAVRSLKRLAVDFELALLATAHLPQLAARADRRPQLDDFGALGAIKQHADAVLGLFREGMYDASQSLEGATELHVLKNRNGATGYADLYFYARWMRFEDLVDPDR